MYIELYNTIKISKYNKMLFNEIPQVKLLLVNEIPWVKLLSVN